jgi:photosystem II stability/assembly factor-like uncharacterized protein
MKEKVFFLALLLFLPSCLQGEKAPANGTYPLKEEVGEGMTAPELGHVHVMGVSPTGAVYLGLHHGLAVSYDGGETWRELKVSSRDLEDFMALTLDPNNPDVIYTGGHGHGIWKSEDSGKTWKLYSKGLPPGPDIHALTISPGSSHILYAMLSGKGIYRSDDGGVRWNRVKTDLDTYAITTLAVDVKDEDRLYAGGTGTGVLLSTDGGRSWKPVGKGLLNPDVIAITMDFQGRLYAGTRGGIFKSDDRGKTWRLIKDLEVEAFGLSPADPSYMVAASKKGFYKSTDGGFVWSVVFETKEEQPSVFVEEELIRIAGPSKGYRPSSWDVLGREEEGNVSNAVNAFDKNYDDISTYATVRAQGCDSNFAVVYEWIIDSDSAEPILYYHWNFIKEVDRASIWAYDFGGKSWEELYAIVDMTPMKKRSLRIPEKFIGPGNRVRLSFEVVTPCSVGEMQIFDVYLRVPS